MKILAELANSLVLGDLLAALVRACGAFELVAHWTQGEFHHDVVLRLAPGMAPELPRVLVVATNCNGGVKEILAFDEVPSRNALWDYRVGQSSAAAIKLRDSVRTLHWFDPRELLGDDARSEIKPQYRQRQERGGWQLRSDLVRAARASRFD